MKSIDTKTLKSVKGGCHSGCYTPPKDCGGGGNGGGKSKKC